LTFMEPTLHLPLSFLSSVVSTSVSMSLSSALDFCMQKSRLDVKQCPTAAESIIAALGPSDPPRGFGSSMTTLADSNSSNAIVNL
jgi:hypothetical protein